MSERAKWEPEDDDFIAPEGEATVYGDDDDDYVPSMSEDSEPHIEEVMEPHARKPDIPTGEKASGSELDGIRVTARYNSMEAQPPTPKTKKKKKKKQRQPVRRKPRRKPEKKHKKHISSKRTKRRQKQIKQRRRYEQRKHKRHARKKHSSSSSSSGETSSSSSTTVYVSVTNSSGPSSSPDSSSSDEETFSTETDTYDTSSGLSAEEARYERYARQRKRYRASTPTVIYTANDLRGVKPPKLAFGDDAAIKEFRLAYIKYGQQHDNVMRQRPKSHQVLPRTVVECIDPDLLVYICKHELPKRYRTNRPELVDAKAVHDWVMKPRVKNIETEDKEGIASLKKLTCDLGGENGIREVQQMFIQVNKIRRLYRLKTHQKTIIQWLVSKIKPRSVKRTITNILKQDTAQARKQARKLSAFHKLVMRVAKTFWESIQLGIFQGEDSSGKASKNGGSDQSSKQNNRSKKQSGAGGDKSGQNKQQKKKAKDGKSKSSKVECFQCGDNHYVSKCSEVSEE